MEEWRAAHPREPGEAGTPEPAVKHDGHPEVRQHIELATVTGQRYHQQRARFLDATDRWLSFGLMVGGLSTAVLAFGAAPRPGLTAAALATAFVAILRTALGLGDKAAAEEQREARFASLTRRLRSEGARSTGELGKVDSERLQLEERIAETARTVAQEAVEVWNAAGGNRKGAAAAWIARTSDRTRTRPLGFNAFDAIEKDADVEARVAANIRLRIAKTRRRGSLIESRLRPILGTDWPVWDPPDGNRE